MTRQFQLYSMRVFFIFSFVLSLATVAHSQALELDGKNIGIFVSSKRVDFTSDYYLPITQFLKLDEDRSWADRFKSEFLIKLLELYCSQLKEVNKADSVYFLNANLYQTETLLASYDPYHNSISSQEIFANIDYLFVIDSLDLSIRKGRSVFIRSNRMYTEQIDINQGHLAISVFQKNIPKAVRRYISCRDAGRDRKIDTYFDFYSEESPLGKFLSQLFTQNWVQLKNDERSSCSSE